MEYLKTEIKENEILLLTYDPWCKEHVFSNRFELGNKTLVENAVRKYNEKLDLTSTDEWEIINKSYELARKVVLEIRRKMS